MGHRVIYSSRYVTYGGQNYVKPISVLIYDIGCLINIIMLFYVIVKFARWCI